MNYHPKPDNHIGHEVKVVLDLSNYDTKTITVCYRH